MYHTTIIKKTITFVKETLSTAEGGHDWFHIERVWKSVKHIAAKENVGNILVIELGALLHDIADSKFHNGDESVGPAMARNFLESIDVEEEITTQVLDIIKHISFKGGEMTSFSSIELDIVQDADRLDAIGAIGIARTFNYGGYKGNKLYDPAIAPNLNMSKSAYKKGDNPTINHFYEKLLLLKDLMNTRTGKQLAQKRHDYMLGFLKQFYAEWNSEL